MKITVGTLCTDQGHRSRRARRSAFAKKEQIAKVPCGGPDLSFWLVQRLNKRRTDPRVGSGESVGRGSGGEAGGHITPIFTGRGQALLPLGSGPGRGQERYLNHSTANFKANLALHKTNFLAPNLILL